MRLFMTAILGITSINPAFAADIGEVLAKPPEFTAQVDLNLYDAERCIITTHNIGIPTVYRQPDLPEDVMLVWRSVNGNVEGLLQMNGSESITVKFRGNDRIWRLMQSCIYQLGKTDQ